MIRGNEKQPQVEPNLFKRRQNLLEYILRISGVYRRATNRGEEERSHLPFFENRKKVP